MKKLQKKGGFTLAELLIVIAVVAALVAIAIPVLAGQKERADQAVDMTTMRAAYSELMMEHIDGDTVTDRVYYYDPTGEKPITTIKPAEGYGKSKTPAGEWWTGTGSAAGIPNSGIPAVLQLRFDENGVVSFIWGGGSYTGLNVTGPEQYGNLSQQQRVERDRTLIDALQSELQNMTYGELHDLLFNPDGSYKGDFGKKSVVIENGREKSEKLAVNSSGIGGLCITLAESTITEGGVVDASGTKNKNRIMPDPDGKVEELFTNAGYNVSDTATDNYLITSTNGTTNARIWACLGISENELRNMNESSDKWNQKASTAYTYIKSSGKDTDPSLQQKGRKP